MNGASFPAETGFDVAHGQVLLAILGATVIGILIWAAIARLTPGQFRPARTATFLAWPVGLLALFVQPVAMTLLPGIALWNSPEALAGLGLATSAGAALTALAVALTLATLMVSAVRRLSRR